MAGLAPGGLAASPHFSPGGRGSLNLSCLGAFTQYGWPPTWLTNPHPALRFQGSENTYAPNNDDRSSRSAGSASRYLQMQRGPPRYSLLPHRPGAQDRHVRQLRRGRHYRRLRVRAPQRPDDAARRVGGAIETPRPEGLDRGAWCCQEDRADAAHRLVRGSGRQARRRAPVSTTRGFCGIGSTQARRSLDHRKLLLELNAVKISRSSNAEVSYRSACLVSAVGSWWRAYRPVAPNQPAKSRQQTGRHGARMPHR